MPVGGDRQQYLVARITPDAATAYLSVERLRDQRISEEAQAYVASFSGNLGSRIAIHVPLQNPDARRDGARERAMLGAHVP
jgi:hypothetical protein